MSTLGKPPQALANSSTTIYMGPTLKLDVDQSSLSLELLKADGSHVNVWGKTLQYAFAPQQTLVTLYFTPVPGSDPVAASYVHQGTTVQSTQQSGTAVITIQRPANSGVSFDIQVDQGSSSLVAPVSASAIGGQAASARMATSPKLAGLVSSGSAIASDPGARLQTRLVLTTVDPPPDPDARPPVATG